MKKVDDIINLIAGNGKRELKEEFLSEIRKEPADLDVYKKVKTAWAFLSSSRQASDYRIEQNYQHLHDRIHSSGRTFQVIKPFKYAAALILLLGVASAMFYLGRNSSFSGSGSQYTSIVAEYGQISKVVLPDSTIVWLNSGTTLTYNNHFAIDNRELNLEGQAYLSVTKNERIPLDVVSGDIKVRVLGTKFDVRAYPEDQQISVVLETGSVELLSSTNKSFSYRLSPGEMAEYRSDTKNVRINEINPTNYTTWKDGELVFIDDPMDAVIRRLERKFDVEIIVHNPRVYQSIFNANFKNEDLIEILDYIQFSCPITYQLVSKEGDEKQKIVLN